MNKVYFYATLILVLSAAHAAFSQSRYWVAPVSGLWNDSNNWSISSGGPGGASVPGPGNVAIFNSAGNGDCTLNVAPTVNGLTVSGYTGTIDINGFTLTTTGNNVFATGGITDGTSGPATLAFSSAGTTTFSGTMFNVPVSGSSAAVYFSGSTFNGSVSMTKTGASTDSGDGGNVFNSTVSLTMAGSNEWWLGQTGADIFATDVSLTLTGTGVISLARSSAGNQFNGDVTITYTAPGNVHVGDNGGTAVLADTRTMSIAGYGASGCGNLLLKNFTQTGNTAQNIVLAGNETGTLTVGPASTFNGALAVSAPVLVLETSTFNSTADFTQTGSAADGNSPGGNVFQTDVTFTNTGDRDIQLGYTGGYAGDLFYGKATFYDLGGGRIRVATATAGNIFYQDAEFYSSGATDALNRIQVSRNAGASATFKGQATFVNNGNSSDIHISYDAGTATTFEGDLVLVSATSATGSFYVGVDGTIAIDGDIQITSTCADSLYFSKGTGTATFGNGTITVPAFTAGSLRFRNFTHTGTAAQTLNLAGTADLRIGPASTFNANVDFRAPQLYLDGCTYNGTAYLEKTGAGDNVGTGGDIFKGVTTITNSGSGTLDLGYTVAETFDDDLTLNNTGTARIQVGVDAAGTVINGDLTINHGGSTAGNRNTVLARNAGSSVTINGNVILNGTNTGIESGILVGFDGNVTINGNVSMSSTDGRGIFFGDNDGVVILETGYALTAGTFSAGMLSLKNFTQKGNTSQTLTLTGSAAMSLGTSTTFNGNVDFTTPQLHLNGCTFNGTAALTKNGATDDSGNGGNVFNGTTTITNAGAGYLLMAFASPDQFNAGVTFSNTGTNIIYVAHNVAGTVFNGNVVVQNVAGGGGVYFCNNAGSSATLSTGRTISIGTGFPAGELRLQRFTQQGTTAQSLTLTGSAMLRLGPASAFGGDVQFSAPGLMLHGATYSGTAYLEKTGATPDASSGGNTFNKAATIVNSGTNYLLTANSSPDIFNGDLTLTNTGSSDIRMADNTAGNQFNGNIRINSTAGGAIYFGNSANGYATLAATKTIAIGASGVFTGDLRLKRFTQTGATAQSLNLTGTAALTLGPSSSFGGNVNFTAPQLYLNGTTFGGTAYLEKNGVTNNTGEGGNTFNGATTIVNSGSNYLLTAGSAPDTFNAGVTLTNMGLGSIRMADAAPGTLFNDNVVVNSTAGSGILFGNSGGTSTLAAGKTITLGGSGFSTGDLRLSYFTQNGATAQSLVLSSTAKLILGPSSAFNGNVNFRAPQLYLQGATYNGTAYLEKNGAENNIGIGGNVFNKTATIVNSGSGYLLSAYTSADTFNDDVTLTNTGSNIIYMAYTAPGNAFNGNITLNNTGSNEIRFGTNAGTSVLAAGKTIAVGSSGFSGGGLWLRYFRQLGATPQALTFTGTALLRLGGNVEFNGDVTFIVPRIFLDGGTYNGTVYIEKNGASADDSYGNNTFNAPATIVNSGAGNMRLSVEDSGANSGDTFNANVTFKRTSSGLLTPASRQVSRINAGLTVDAPAGITLGSATTGVITFSGAAAQTVNKTSGSASPVFQQLAVDKTAGDVTLNTDISVGTAATLTSGIINTTAASYLNFADDATLSGGSSASYVNGPVRKTGNDAFTFPTGSEGIYRAIGISAPASAATAFTAQYFYAAQSYGFDTDPSLVKVSDCEYWTLDRTAGTDAVNVTLSWNSPDCSGEYIGDLPALSVARFDGTRWVDHGNGATTGDATAGTVTTSSQVTTFSPFTIATNTPDNLLPVKLLYFTATVQDDTVYLAWETAFENDNDFFTVERSYDNVNFQELDTVKGAGNSTEPVAYALVDPRPYKGITSYYSLKQTSFNGLSAYLDTVSVFVDASTGGFLVYPNPVSQDQQYVYFNATFQVVVYNSLGQQIMETKYTNGLDISLLAPGVYNIRNSKGEIARLVVY